MSRAPKRRKPTKDEMIAILALAMKRGDGTPIITRRECAGMTAAEIVAKFKSKIVLAHGRAHALGGSQHPTNIWATPREEDALETPKDIRDIRRVQRIVKKREAMIPVDVRGARDDGFHSPAPRKPAKRAWPKHKMKSRPFDKKRRAAR